jgi:hypothetical protein
LSWICFHIYCEENDSSVQVCIEVLFSSFVFRLFLLFVLYRSRISLNKQFHIDHTLILYTQVVTLCTTRFNVQESCAMPTRCIYAFCVGSQNKLQLFLLCGLNSIFKYNSVQSYPLKVSHFATLPSKGIFLERRLWQSCTVRRRHIQKTIAHRRPTEPNDWLIRNCERLERQLRQLSAAARNTNRTTKRLVALVHFIWNTESRNSYKPKKDPSPFRLSCDKPINVRFILLLSQGENSWWQLGMNSSSSVVWVTSS